MEEQSIIGGWPVESGQFTYQVSLAQKPRDASEKIIFCGGAIIDDFHIITAAHCILNANNEFRDSDFQAIVGSIYAYYYEEDQNFSVLKSYVPTAYKGASNGGLNDIAILKVRF